MKNKIKKLNFYLENQNNNIVIKILFPLYMIWIDTTPAKTNKLKTFLNKFSRKALNNAQ